MVSVSSVTIVILIVIKLSVSSVTIVILNVILLSVVAPPGRSK